MDWSINMNKMKASQKRKFQIRALIAFSIVLAMTATLIPGLIFLFGETQSADELIRMGSSSFKEGNYDRAIDLYAKAAKKDPLRAEAHNLLGMAYRMKYRTTNNPKYREKEVQSFKKAIEIDPRNVSALVNLGTTLYDMNKRQEAVPYLRKALEIQPDHPDRAQIEELIEKASGSS